MMHRHRDAQTVFRREAHLQADETGVADDVDEDQPGLGGRELGDDPGPAVRRADSDSLPGGVSPMAIRPAAKASTRAARSAEAR
jgi:hypothetical protein